MSVKKDAIHGSIISNKVLKKLALVAVAHKLLRQAYSVLKKQKTL
jgi:hypothetical protein